MTLVVIGLNHRSAPLELLERVTVKGDGLPKALHELCGRPDVREAVVLSTCNRTEVYVVAERFHGAYADVRDYLCDLGHLAPEDIAGHLYAYFDDEAARHLFTVAAGLDSAVLGDTEILGQVRSAWERATAEGAARSALGDLFRHALEVGKRSRTETGISRHTASISHAAVELATDALGTLAGRTVVIVGAGEMGEGMAVALAAAGPASVLVANRTVGRAEELAARVGGRAIPLAAVPAALVDTDVVLTSTGADGTVVDSDDVTALMADRPERPLLIVDVAVPRDVDPAVGRLPGVTLYDLDDLRDFAARGIAERAAEAASVRRIVDDEVDRYLDRTTARTVAPLVGTLHERAEEVRRAELDRIRGRLGALDDRQREAVEAMTRRLVAKLLHDPSVRLKDAAGTPRGERLAEAVRELFF